MTLREGAGRSYCSVNQEIGASRGALGNEQRYSTAEDQQSSNAFFRIIEF